MSAPMSRLAAVLALIAGAILCLPQVAGASNAHRVSAVPVGRHAAIHWTITTAVSHPTTTMVAVALIPPIVVFPPAAARPASRARATVTAADPPTAIAAQDSRLLPSTGSRDVGAIAICGLGLIGLGLMIRRAAEAG